MLLRICLWFSLLALPLSCFAGRDLILFVGTADFTKQIRAQDYDEETKTFGEFAEMVQKANENLSENEKPVVIRLEMPILEDLPFILEKALKEKGLTDPENKISMIFFSGHGGPKEFLLNDGIAYSGKRVAQILMSPLLKGRIAAKASVYFGACRCGKDSHKGRGFQVDFMGEFKKLNEMRPLAERLQSLVSVAHQYISTSKSAFGKMGRFSLIAYRLGFFKAYDRFEWLLLNTLGRTAFESSSAVFAYGLWGAFYRMQFLNGTAEGPVILGTGALAVVIHFLLHAGLQSSSSIAKKMEYILDRDPQMKPVFIQSGDGVYSMVTKFMCHSVYAK